MEHPQTEGFVDILTTFATIEKVFLDIVTDGEQITASSVGGCVNTIEASNTPGDGTW